MHFQKYQSFCEDVKQVLDCCQGVDVFVKSSSLSIWHYPLPQPSTTLEPSQHHPSTTLAPPQHHHSTLIAPSQLHPSTTLAPSQHHPSLILAPSQHHPSTILVPSQHHPSTILAPSQHHPSTKPVQSQCQGCTPWPHLKNVNVYNPAPRQHPIKFLL